MPTSRRHPLTAAEVDEWYAKHIPYRLRILMSWTTRYRRGDTYPPDLRGASFESGLMHCRSFLSFLGLRLKHRPTLQLAPDRNYSDRDADEVKVVDLGGRFVDIGALPNRTADLLLRGLVGANKASAHLTHTNHGFQWRSLPALCDATLHLVRVHLFDTAGRPMPDLDWPPLGVPRQPVRRRPL